MQRFEFLLELPLTRTERLSDIALKTLNDYNLEECVQTRLHNATQLFTFTLKMIKVELREEVKP